MWTGRRLAIVSCCNFHPLPDLPSTLPSQLKRSRVNRMLTSNVELSSLAMGEAQGLAVRVHSSVWSRGSDGRYKRGIVTYLSPDESTATIKTSDGRTTRDVPGKDSR